MTAPSQIGRTEEVRPDMDLKRTALLANLELATVLFVSSPALAQVSLGTAGSFAVLGGSIVDNTGATVITGDLGVSPGSAINGFPPGIVNNGTIHAADAVALQAQTDLTTTYNLLAGRACDTDLTGQDLGGLTLTPGTYCYSTSAQLTGTLTLDAQGTANAAFVFQVGAGLTTATNSDVLLINAGSPCSVFWQVGSSADLGTTSTFAGSVLALTQITLHTGTSVSGRVLARNGAVTLDVNTVDVSECTIPQPLIFADGFETGDTSRWSASVP